MSISDYLDKISRNSGQAPRDVSVKNSFSNLSILGKNAPIHLNTENNGYTFFTRPCMNLAYDNVMADRRLSQLLVENPDSIERAIRSYLDPIAQRAGLQSSIVDPLNPFIPLLSNNLISISGFPDMTTNVATTTPGIYRDVHIYIDDVPYQYEAYDIQASFRNIAGDPITYLSYMWQTYGKAVREGICMPYPDMIFLNEMDYFTRIYRLVMDSTRTYVYRIMACGAAVPTAASVGVNASYSGDGSETPFATAAEQITIPFRAVGFTVYDHILIYEFNTLVEMFNSNMTDEQRLSGSVMHKLNPWEKEYFNSVNKYPYINPITMELEWWIPIAAYNAEAADNPRKAPTPNTAPSNTNTTGAQ